MPHYRFYIPEDLVLHAIVKLQDEETRHLVKVMRAGPGDTVELMNGKGCLAQAEVTSVSKNECTLTIQELHHELEDKVKIVLLQAIPKMNRLDTILEKATELGVNEIILFPGERSEKHEMSRQQMLRAESIVIAASKQCGRLFLPKITLLGPINNWPSFKGILLFGDVNPKAKKLWDVLENSTNEDVHFCVGPEAGLSANEEKILIKKGFIGVTLHGNILRTDTAPIAALAIISHRRL